MQFSTIVRMLQDTRPPQTTFLIADETREVTALLYHQPDTGAGSPDVLYVLYDEMIGKYSALPQNILLVYKTAVTRDRLLHKIRRDNPETNVVSVHWSEQGALLNHLQMLFSSDDRHAADYATFLRMIISGHDLSYVLTEAARQCGHQLVAVDFSGKLLAYSRNVSVLSPDWVQFIGNGYCSAEFMEHCNDTVLKRPEISSKPECYVCQETGTVYYSSPIVINRMAQGYVFMLSEHNDASALVYDILPVISSVAGDYIQRHKPELSVSNQVYYRLLQDILEGESHNSIVSRVRTAKLRVPKQMCALVITSYYYQNSILYSNGLNNKLAPRFLPVPPIQHGNHLILIMDMDPSRAEYNQRTMTFLEELSKTYRLIVGVSNEFYDLEDFAKAYRQAEQALVLAGRLNLKDSIVYYRELAFFDMLRNLSAGEHMKSYCHPALEFLRQYDIANNTELFTTLKVYIQTMMNLKETAVQLFTHKNTIIYRRQRIIELTGLDFQNAAEIFNLAYSFKIYEYLDL